MSTPYAGFFFKLGPPSKICSGFITFPIDFDIFKPFSSTANPCTNKSLKNKNDTYIDTIIFKRFFFLPIR